jgi:hypothetical protein
MFLCGWEAWSVTLREERRPGVFLDWVLREIFGSKKEEMKGDRRKLHSEEFQQLTGCCEHRNGLICYMFRQWTAMFMQ